MQFMFTIDYETEIPIENKEALRKEVDEIMSVFRKDVEDAKAKTVIIDAIHYWLGGLVRQDKIFFLIKDDDRWRPLGEV